MKSILLFGAGKSASVLIEYLLANAAENNWRLTVADADKALIEQKTKSHPASAAIGIDVSDTQKRKALIVDSDLVISMMPAALHILIAKDCLEYSKHLLTASYADDEIKKLSEEVKNKGIIFLCEMGLDPGIDHMSAMQLIDKIKSTGGKITSFCSHCGGLVAPESDDNPWHYKISWNPRNVVLAGKAGAEYRENNRVIKEKYEHLFDAGRSIATGNESIGSLSYYPNRNSLPYIDLYDLHEAETFVRTTLRYRDFMLGWKNIIDLKLTDEVPVYNSDGLSLAAFFQQHFDKYELTEKLVEAFKENEAFTSSVLTILAEKLGPAGDTDGLVANKSGDLLTKAEAAAKEPTLRDLADSAHDSNIIYRQLLFLGMADDETTINKGLISAADGLQFAMETKLALSPADKDMIVMQHDISYEFAGLTHNIVSSLIVKGDDSIHTAMAKTVGLPLGIAAKLILAGEIKLSGIHLPIVREIYEPVLLELEKNGVRFVEKNG